MQDLPLIGCYTPDVITPPKKISGYATAVHYKANMHSETFGEMQIRYWKLD